MNTSVRDAVLPVIDHSIYNNTFDLFDSIYNSSWADVWSGVNGNIWFGIMDKSVDDAVWAYRSSFFAMKEWYGIKSNPYENPFQPAIDLWEKGLVPAFDGEKWRLYDRTGFIFIQP